MGSGRDFSPYQKKIVDRYYEHKDTIVLNKLGELVSDLYLCTDSKQLSRHWEGVAKALAQLKVPESRIRRVCGMRKVELLAELVTELTGGAKAPPVPAPPVPAPPVPAPQAGTPQPGPAAEPASAPAGSSAPAGPQAAPPGHADPLSPEALKHTIKSFRKRLKLARLDEESQIGSSRNPLTGGARSNIAAIVPPSGFPREVWEELVKQGKLKRAGTGFYTLVE